MSTPTRVETASAAELLAAGPTSSRAYAEPFLERASTRPIVAAVDGTAAGVAAADAAARLARQVRAPLVLVYVRTGPPGWLGKPYFQRRLDREMKAAGSALAAAHTAAERHGVVADSEVLEGRPARRIREFAEQRNARVVVLGSRHRRLKRSVSRRVVDSAERPVLVAGKGG
jgi:nucleotide-binding universal stress UspA family protein